MLSQAQAQHPTIGQNHIMQRDCLVGRHTRMMNKIMKDNSIKDKYWIVGWAMSKRRNGKTKIFPMMKAVYEIPEVQKESYLYEVDNISGTKTLIWVMHPNNKLNIPLLGKSIHVADDSGV